MNQTHKLIKIGTRDLADAYGKDLVEVIFEYNPETPFWATFYSKKNDLNGKFVIWGGLFVFNKRSDFKLVDSGLVLVKDGRVVLYSEKPGKVLTGSDLSKQEYNRERLVVRNIDQLLGYDEKPAFSTAVIEFD